MFSLAVPLVRTFWSEGGVFNVAVIILHRDEAFLRPASPQRVISVKMPIRYLHGG